MSTAPALELLQALCARFAFAVRAVIGVALFWAVPHTAYAQQQVTVVNSTDGTISGAIDCAGSNRLVRNFVVSQNFIVGDVNLGVFAEHTWRGDIVITIDPPNGPPIQLVNGDVNNTSGDNFNVLLDDSAAQLVNTDPATGAHSTTAPPPFANTFRPNSALNAINGQSSAGTWRMEICDAFPNADNGTFRHAELYLTEAVPEADLSLALGVSPANPLVGDTVTYTLTVSSANTSDLAASGVTVDFPMPTGANYVSQSGTGSYDQSTGVWTVGNLAIGGSSTITITATNVATAGATITGSTEVATSSVADGDSTPGNGSTFEDDDDTASYTVGGTRTAGTPPTLVCPAGVIPFNWTGRTWTAGSTSNTYNLTAFGTVAWDLFSPAGWMNIASLGGQHPVLTTQQGQTVLSKAIDFANRDQVSTTTITFQTAIDGAQIKIIDVDYAANDFADQVTVVGYKGAATVIPTLTNGISNYVIGNSAFGDAGSDPDSTNGDVYATFDQPIDRIVIEYGNHSLAPLDPDGQAIQMAGSISLCTPEADLNVTKTSSLVSDPVTTSGDAFHIPGAVMEYCILMSNSGPSAASNIVAVDNLPPETTYVTGSLRTGTNCSNATTGEDDDASGADETDPFGASFAAGSITMTATSIDDAETVAYVFQATID